MTCRHWPEGVGVLLANETAAAGEQPPRLLTLGSDTEVLRREGQRLEASFGRDRSNGWAYDFALNKLRAYQELLLGDDEPAAPSVAELEEQGQAVVDQLEHHLSMRLRVRARRAHIMIRELVQRQRASIEDAHVLNVADGARIRFIYQTCQPELFEIIVRFATS